MPRVFEKLVTHHERGQAADRRTVLIIDEIDRANLAQVLGELIYGLEYRGSAIRLTYALPEDQVGLSKDATKLTVPKAKAGFFIIGTMNTADRSVGRIHYAVRRRFAFQQLSPDRSVIINQGNVKPEQKEWAAKLFDAVAYLFADKHLAPEFHSDDVQVGHTYFLGPQETVRFKIAYQVYPLLREYLKDGILLREDRIDLTLPYTGEALNLAEDIRVSQLVSKLDESWAKRLSMQTEAST